MAFQFPLDELGVINSALAATGDNFVAVANDGSDEWTVADPAYQRALGYMMEGHNWGNVLPARPRRPIPNGIPRCQSRVI
jgi:hypothetical protein